jgi:hypothetical protein
MSILGRSQGGAAEPYSFVRSVHPKIMIAYYLVSSLVYFREGHRVTGQQKINIRQAEG